MFKLRPYQQHLVDENKRLWSEGVRNPCTVLSTGGGKTVVAAELIRQEQQAGGYFAAIAHRQELVGQISLALARQGVMHDIVAPRSVIRFCSNMHVEEVGQSFYSQHAPGFVGGVNTVIRRDLKRIKDAVSLVFQDECFPAGTLVRTPSGDVRIESVEIGDTVMAFDEDSGKFKARIVDRLFKNPISDELVRVEIQPHHVLICTKGHPFYTKRGWVQAANLTNSDEVLYDGMEMRTMRLDTRKHYGESEISSSEARSDILFERVQSRVQQNTPQKTRTETKTCREMSHVRKGRQPVGLSTDSIQENRTRLLFESLFECLPCDEVESDRGGDQSEIRIKTYDREQPHEERKVTREDAEHSDRYGSRTENTRRERAPADGRRNETIGNVWVSGFHLANDSINWSVQTSSELSETLQDRLWERDPENSDRSGRGFSYVTHSSRSGQKERLRFNWTRLESVSILKQSDSERIGDGFTYNIEVRDLHTYVANGVVVHNCHHVLRDNLWGKAAALFPKANGLYVTATPLRADGKGLGRHADGLFDQFIFGPPMRQLIREGSLTDYKIYAPPTDIDLTAMKFGSDGDFSRPELVKRAKKSGIVGDVVTNYAKYCNGVQTVVFVVDVEQAREVADMLNASGVKSVALSANNTDSERQEAIGAFKRREIQVIVNVDLLGEGFDCPAIECVIMARPTASYGLYSQQFGRAIRLLDGKQFGLIIDMVGNVKRHGLPDAPREWSLDRREKRGKSDAGAPTVKTCTECMGVHAVGPTSCPYCGHVAIAGAGGRGELVIVDAELRELTPEELADMRGEADKLSKEWNVPYGGSKTQIMAAISHNKTVGAQRELRDAVALYAGAFRAMGVPDEMIHVQMWQSYGTNVSQLQTLRPKDANALRDRIMKDLQGLGVTV